VVPIQANKGIGLDKLKEAVAVAAEQGPPERRPAFPEAFEREVASLSQALDTEPFLARRVLLDVDGYAQKRFIESHGQTLLAKLADVRSRLSEAGCAVPAVEARTRYAWIREVVAGCVERPAVRPRTWTDRLDKILTHRVWGTLVFLLLMFIVFQAIFTGA